MNLDEIISYLNDLELDHHRQWVQDIADHYHRRLAKARSQQKRNADEMERERYGPDHYGPLGAKREG